MWCSMGRIDPINRPLIESAAHIQFLILANQFEAAAPLQHGFDGFGSDSGLDLVHHFLEGPDPEGGAHMAGLGLVSLLRAEFETIEGEFFGLADGDEEIRGGGRARFDGTDLGEAGLDFRFGDWGFIGQGTVLRDKAGQRLGGGEGEKAEKRFEEFHGLRSTGVSGLWDQRIWVIGRQSRGFLVTILRWIFCHWPRDCRRCSHFSRGFQTQPGLHRGGHCMIGFQSPSGPPFERPLANWVSILDWAFHGQIFLDFLLKVNRAP